MQNFGHGIEPPKSSIEVITSSFSNPKSTHNSVITSHPFNFNIDIFVPQQDNIDTTRVLSELEIVKEEHFYYVCELSGPQLVKLCQSITLQPDHYIYIMTICANSENSNIIAVYPLIKAENKFTHEMVLRLDKDTYERMGLQGSKGKDNSHTKTEHNISVIRRKFPLKHYENTEKGELARLTWAMERVNPVKVLLAIYSTKTQTPVSFDHELSSFVRVQGYGDQLFTSTMNDVAIPDLFTYQDETWENHERILHWLGLASCRYESELRLADEKERGMIYEEVVRPLEVKFKGQLHLIRLRGFIPPHKIVNILNRARQVIQSSLAAPWCAITVSGFEDSPVSFNGLDHGYGISGENDYTFIIEGQQGHDRYWLMRSMGSQEQR
jgi:hypothetical protein